MHFEYLLPSACSIHLSALASACFIGWQQLAEVYRSSSRGTTTHPLYCCESTRRVLMPLLPLPIAALVAGDPHCCMKFSLLAFLLSALFIYFRLHCHCYYCHVLPNAPKDTLVHITLGVCVCVILCGMCLAVLQ